MNHTDKTALQRKLASGQAITGEDIKQAAAYAKATGGPSALALYASLKREAKRQQDDGGDE